MLNTGVGCFGAQFSSGESILNWAQTQADRDIGPTEISEVDLEVPDITKADRQLWVVLVSLVVSCFAISISLFNFVMFKNNDFDPLVIEVELFRRKRRLAKSVKF